MHVKSEYTRKFRMTLTAILSLVGHLLIATMGVIILSALLVFSVYSFLHRWELNFTRSQASWLLTEIPGFPIQASVGLVLGFLLGRFKQSRFIVFSWVLPFLLVCLIALTLKVDEVPVFARLFGSSCSPKRHCFDQLVVTLPFIASFSYSLGGGLRIWSQRGRVEHTDSQRA